ncbi:MAG: diacylglycerol kinase family lipid kinase [Acidobacteriota bacterium]|nr:diacylglycerol kinase family lipid kinase [Acidobacteriota bacterium]
MRRTVLIYNPTAGRHRADRLVLRLETLLRRSGSSVDSQATSGPGDGTRLARIAVAEGVETVFACGGDGSLRECANGLLGSKTGLGFLPAGTTNVMARTLGLPSDPLAAARVLSPSRWRPFDVGLCNDEPFLMQASAGLDAEVLGRVRTSRKRVLGRGEVALAALSAWHSYGYPEFAVAWAGGSRCATFAAVCNIPFYAGRFRLAPTASWCDDRLDLVLFGGTSRLATLGFARDLGLGRLHQRHDVFRQQVKEATIAATEGVELQIDGDLIVGALPATIRLAARKVRMLVPVSDHVPPTKAP